MNNPPRILLVDDESLNLDYLQQELEDKEYELLTATNGKEALDAIKESLPDLVLLDIMMPIMDGFVVLEQVKSDPDTRHIPIIIISANNDLQSVVKGIKLGAEDYLPKPFEPTILQARISASLERKRLRDLEQVYMQSLEKELNIARNIQKEFLPRELPQVEGWEIAAYFKAAKFVAGDYYDAFTLPDGNLVLVLGDVCGKGVGAALFMTLFRSLIRAASSSLVLDGSPAPAARIGGAVHTTNKYISETHEDALIFSTLFVGLLDSSSGTLTYINAGNESPYLMRASGDMEELRPTGPVIGFNRKAKFASADTHLEPGDSLLVFTDGIPDSKNSEHEFYGRERLVDFLKQGIASPVECVNRLGGELEAFIGEAEQFDDITMLALRRL